MNYHLTKDIRTDHDFKAYVSEVRGLPGYREPIGFGIFRARHSEINPSKILTGAFPVTNWQENAGSAAVFQQAAGLVNNPDHAHGAETVIKINDDMVKNMSRVFAPFNKTASGKHHQNVQVVKALANNIGSLDRYYMVMIYRDSGLESLPAAYLKLGAMSLRKIKPRETCFDNIFEVLSNMAWSGTKAYEIEWLQDNALALTMNGQYPQIDYEDKIPRYTAMVPPEASIRILSAHNVRWGAHLAPGTTVMPGASYINFNAGTLEAKGPAGDNNKPGIMVEGRISSQATVGNGTDVGGGASILGTLSGGNDTPVIIGEQCLLGANSVTGFSLGDNCIVDAGISILAGTKFNIADEDLAALAKTNPETAFAAQLSSRSRNKHWKGYELAGLSGMHFRQNSQSGALTVKRNTRAITLNDALHGVAPKP